MLIWPTIGLTGRRNQDLLVFDMKNALIFGWLSVFVVVSNLSAQEPIEIGFLWHMHQPTYRPGQTIFQTESSGAFSFSIVDVHNQRLGPYTAWPRNAIQSGLGLANLGASVSFLRFIDPES